MEKVISNLREKSILHQNQVMDIKKYINEKYKGEEASRKAIIFANAVHTIVDESVKKFEKQHRLKIRAEVLKSAVAKDIFDINGYDVFEVCSLLPIEEDSENTKEQFFQNLTDWLNENQEEEVSLQETKAITSQIIDDAVYGVVNLLEESLLFEPGIKDFVHNESVNSMSYNDNPDLEDHITDGRFMDIEGDVVELSALDIEKAIIDSMDLYGDLDDVEVEEKIDKNIIRKEMNKRKSIEQKDVIRENKIKTIRRSGYELKPPKVVERSSGVTFQVKLIIIIPAILVALALIIFLIIGAVSISNKNTQIDKLKNELKQMQEASVNAVSIISEKVPTAVVNSTAIVEVVKVIEGVNYTEGSHLAEVLKYRSINPALLKEYLESKNSLLSENYYIDMFIQVAKDYNVNPLLLVAITGQEQNFVPMDHPDAALIKNNPFNVYISWKKYNTNFKDACKIAARTILTSSEGRPEDVNPIKWINTTYAEDKDWHIGVSYFFNELTVMVIPE